MSLTFTAGGMFDHCAHLSQGWFNCTQLLLPFSLLEIMLLVSATRLHNTLPHLNSAVSWAISGKIIKWNTLSLAHWYLFQGDRIREPSSPRSSTSILHGDHCRNVRAYIQTYAPRTPCQMCMDRGYPRPMSTTYSSHSWCRWPSDTTRIKINARCAP